MHSPDNTTKRFPQVGFHIPVVRLSISNSKRGLGREAKRRKRFPCGRVSLLLCTCLRFSATTSEKKKKKTWRNTFLTMTCLSMGENTDEHRLPDDEESENASAFAFHRYGSHHQRERNRRKITNRGPAGGPPRVELDGERESRESSPLGWKLNDDLQ